jgi:acetyl-CoA C-acetyltransferase
MTASTTISVIVSGARTPIGKLGGALKGMSGSDLGAVAIMGALKRANVPADLVDYVIMGQVLTAGAGQLPARQAAVGAGIGWHVPALTINKMCLSGLDAIALADQMIRAGDYEVVVAGGQESMTSAPHLLIGSRDGYKYGDVRVLDHLAYDGLHDMYTDQAMGALTEQRNNLDGFTRAAQDEFAALSHRRAAVAWKDGVFTDEVAPVLVPQRRGDSVEFTVDQGVRANARAESLAGLPPAFREDGTITAASSSQISDGDEQGTSGGIEPRVAV